MAVLKGDALLSWVAESCAAQGLLVKVTDPRTTARVSDLLNGGTAGPGRGASTAGTATRRSKAPNRADPSGVQLPRAEDARLDLDMVEDRVDDRSLSQEAETRPLAS